MQKRWMAAMSAAVMLCAQANASPVLVSHEYTAYLNEEHQLVIVNGETVRQVKVEISDLLAIDEQRILAMTPDHQLWSMPLVTETGHIADVVSVNPTQQEIDELLAQVKLSFTLKDGMLVCNGSVISTQTKAACSDADTLYYAENDALKAIPMVEGQYSPITLKENVQIASMTALKGIVAIITEQHHLIVYQCSKQNALDYGTVKTDIAAAAAIDNKLILYSKTSNGYQVNGTMQLQEGPLVLHVNLRTATPTPVPTPTPDPNNRIAKEGYVSQGDRGEMVEAMQRRLKKLGYPVGSVDGIFGKKTLLALNLFQFAVGYTEHSYADERCINRLNRSNAPKYDPYLPLSNGQKGTPIRIMQDRLKELGYYTEESNGKYDDYTVLACQRFQLLSGQPGDGKSMSKDQLELLYDEKKAPANITPVPTPEQTEQPPVDPTEKPEETPVVDPTEKPEETDKPIVDPTEKPEETPVVDPTERPEETDKPAVDPTETPGNSTPTDL